MITLDLVKFSEEIDIIEDEKIFDSQRNLNMDNVDRTIRDLYNDLSRDKIILDVDYQRNYVWSDVQASKLIESFLINIPIPSIYMAENSSSNWEVIDGVQRLTTIKKYIDDEFQLKGLEILTELNKKKYSDLDENIQNYFDDKFVRCIRIKKESSEDIKFDVFMRLNQGSVKLNEQELRNCLYRGNLNESLKELANSSKEYNLLLGQKKDSYVYKRMKEVELLLRAEVFLNLIVIDEIDEFKYSGRIKKALNTYCSNNRDNQCSENLIRSINFMYEAFEKQEVGAFRLFGETSINLALSETQLVFAHYCLSNNIGTEVYFELICQCLLDTKFVDACKNATGNTAVIRNRYLVIKELLNGRETTT